MDQDTQRLFAEQLAHWAESAISQGRLPFRKVEIYPSLLTEEGEMAPPLVFWINRDSFMAGGVLLLPPKHAEEAVEMGRCCARALGLQHFVTWSVNEIVFWEDRREAPVRCKTLPVPDSGNATAVALRDCLIQVLDELKFFSVIGAVNAENLSAHYLANLCRGTLQASHPYLAEAYRVALGENRLQNPEASPEDLAFQKGAISLLRLLSLLFFDRLPTAVQPEGLERAMHFALDTLPQGLKEALSGRGDDLPLPEESAVRFHHLFRRLTQLRLKESRQRVAEALGLLLPQESSRLGGFPLPEPASPPHPPLLLVNPDSIEQAPLETMVVGPPPLLGLLTLLRCLRDEPAPLALAPNPWHLSVPVLPRSIRGTLHDNRTPSPPQRQALTAQLRGSWPTRRFPLRSQTPRWVYEFLHLLGVAATDAIIDLCLPEQWLIADFGQPLAELLQEEFTLQRLSRTGPGAVHVRLFKGVNPEAVCTFAGDAEPRHTPLERLREGGRSLLVLALDLPDNLFDLLQDGRLLIRAGTARPEPAERELFLFSRSTLGRFLWSIVSGGQALPQRKFLTREAGRLGLPLPADEVFSALQRVPWEDEQTQPSTEAIDEVIALCLGPELALPGTKAGRNQRRSAKRADPEANAEVEETICAAVFRDGVPRFPEQYLYDYFRPKLVEFAFSGPLSPGEEFFDRFTLRAEDGSEVDVEGAETARALILCSCTGRSAAALPAERQVTAAILERYLADLRELRHSLVRQTHKAISNPKAAAAMIEKIWRTRPLPPWSLVER